MGHKKSDPQQKLESLERWSARATLLILLGIIIEIGLLLWLPHDPVERLVAGIADAFIGIGLVVEYIVILRAIVAGGEAQRLSDEKVAEANERAREAERKTEEEKLSRVRIEREIINQLKPRDFTKEQFDAIVDLIKGKIKVKLTVFVADDPETFHFGLAIRDLFIGAQVDAFFVHLNTSSPKVIGVRSTGMTLYAPGGALNPELRELTETIGNLALGRKGLAIWMYLGAETTPNVPVPSLFVMPKQHPFFWLPEYLVPPELPRPRWEPK